MTKAIVMRTQGGLDELEVVKHGTDIECEAFLFNVIFPSDTVKDLNRLESNDGRLYSVKKFVPDISKWVEVKYMIQYFNED